MSDLGPILASWHEWRAAYSCERKLARLSAPASDLDDDERLERMLLASIEEEIARLPRDMQLALQHAARAEYLSTCAVRNPRLPTGEALAELTERAKSRLWHRLIYLGLL